MSLKSTAFLLFFGFLIGCDSSTESNKGNNLHGSWQLKIISGGFAGINDTLDISKDNYILTFNDNSRFSLLHNDTSRLSGSFEVNVEKTIFSENHLETIHYFDYAITVIIPNDVIYYLNEDTLGLSNNAVDSFSRIYTKVR